MDSDQNESADRNLVSRNFETEHISYLNGILRRVRGKESPL
jgi:hypothetical protein